MKVTKILLSSVLVIGSMATLSSIQASAYNNSSPVSKIYINSTSVGSSLYQSIPKFKKTLSTNKIIWTGKTIKVTANTVEQDNAATFESKVIKSIVISKAKVNQTINTEGFEEKLLDVTSVVDSSSGDWVAIQAAKSAGSTLILVNLKTGKSKNVNDRLVKEGKKGIETIASFNWSPKEDKIAISYGDTEKSSLAIYDPKKDTFEYLPRATNYISTGLVLWHKNGKTLDYISEYPSNQKILFRYNTTNKKVKPVKKITQKEFQQLLKLDKYPEV
ncbi:hypothetical protein HP548_12020 [Paenibacillus taichungensis]|uniref:WD40 repeat protein n=1 Tax=Paenibacillus taichungensis TaxID=484184 RepID=A0ABX2MLC5_9BACL|nr:hypothetical protein [Paenibacillus taichungensis]NUU54805.1 hypothetical protein [Paenibacillus taichungensis]